MRVWISGGGGFVGSNIVRAAVDGGHEVLTSAHTFVVPVDARYSVDRVDMVDDSAVRGSIEQFAPDLVVHCAIMNDWHRMYADRDASWAAYVGATRSTAKAALDDAGAAYVLVSTDCSSMAHKAERMRRHPPTPSISTAP